MAVAEGRRLVLGAAEVRDHMFIKLLPEGMILEITFRQDVDNS